MKNNFIHIFLSAKNKLKQNFGQFELLGGDAMLDHNYNPYILEINSNPSLVINTLEQNKLKPLIIENTLRIVL